MNLHTRIAATVTAGVALVGPLAVHSTAADAAPLPKGALSAARTALHGWSCDSIADEKFSCNRAADGSGGGFTVVLRSTQSLSKWRDDPELQSQIAYVKRRWFVTVQPNPELTATDFAAVKRAVARGRH